MAASTDNNATSVQTQVTLSSRTYLLFIIISINSKSCATSDEQLCGKSNCLMLVRVVGGCNFSGLFPAMFPAMFPLRFVAIAAFRGASQCATGIPPDVC